MNTISIEGIISSLILLGFDNVDNYLFNDALDTISMGEDFELEKKDNSLFRCVITREENSFRLKNNLTINSYVKISDEILQVKKILESNTNNLLMDYLSDMKYNSKKKIKRK